MRVSFLMAPSLFLLLGGCAVGDGIAYAVKAIDQKAAALNRQAEQPDQAEAAPSRAPVPAAAPAAPADVQPAPMPASDPRDEVKVETLPPKR